MGSAMLKVAFSLRMALLIASFGAVLGAGLIFWLGFYKLLHSVQEAFVAETINTRVIAAGVMGATDAFLFGVVLIIFASTITFGFALELPEWLAARLPAWMQVKDISELKETLVQIILIYLIVDFATDIAESETPLSWPALVKPLAVLLIAGSLWLFGSVRQREES
jgi:uncharacterized membrane protein YqhA